MKLLIAPQIKANLEIKTDPYVPGNLAVFMTEGKMIIVDLKTGKGRTTDRFDKEEPLKLRFELKDVGALSEGYDYKAYDQMMKQTPVYMRDVNKKAQILAALNSFDV